jgi:hypothetical protein
VKDGYKNETRRDKRRGSNNYGFALEAPKKPSHAGVPDSYLTIRSCNPQLPPTRSRGRRWVGLPARRFLTADGKVHYEPIIEFTTRKGHRNFLHAALEVVEAYLKARGEW